MVKEKLKVLDLPETMLEDKDVVKAKLAEQARNAAATAQMSTAMSQAQIKGEVAAAFKDLMLGLKAQAGANADVFNSIVEGMINVRAANESDTAGGGGAPAKGARPQSRSGVAGAS
jgi:cytochrome c1